MQMQADTAIPEALFVAYDQVRYLIRKQIWVLSKKEENVFKSLIMWNNQLIQEDYNTFLPIKTDEAGYIFVFQSNWQKNMLIKYGGSMLMLNATHNTVSNYGFGSKKDKENKQKISLYTFLIRDPIIGKGLPVCWAFTLLLAKEPLQQILTWLCQTTGYVPVANNGPVPLTLTVLLV
ncbi:hypothetical protein Pst134EA_024481 [Puccinia striiformis f. sp. tritici]|uniref:hypothetical protein n=1 Tax=Puccinia striiformis f. sp. tritici TaxID=168172 RepID=UPI0020085877|nr:hypothetical protein Pst134EA_024481 [Puccinia striiformis f. sp. tritici]KAH9453612.1 hypothetical protein Pst134EA_024481 [Puccinia striiformis f. sp. tritici]